MSTKLHAVGTREVIANKTGEKSTQQIIFELYSTPPHVTRDILTSLNPELSYRAWVNTFRLETREPVYDDDDYFWCYPPIGYTTVCKEDDHLSELDKFTTQCNEGGYEITFCCV